jgi:hypothetical protein
MNFITLNTYINPPNTKIYDFCGKVMFNVEQIATISIRYIDTFQRYSTSSMYNVRMSDGTTYIIDGEGANIIFSIVKNRIEI